MYHMLFGTRHHSDQLHCRTSRTLNLRESQIILRKCKEELRHTAITKATSRADPAVVVLDSAAGSIRRDLGRHIAKAKVKQTSSPTMTLTSSTPAVSRTTVF
jgi:hypothetical protein